MNTNVLNKSLESLNQDISSIVGSYSFNFPTGVSGFPIASFNEKFDDPVASGVGASGQVLASSIPLYNLCDDKNTNLISGSGFFDGETILEVGTEFNAKNYTIFVEYESDDFAANNDVSRVLFTTMSGKNDSSGVNMGLNGANKPYIEYVDSEGNIRTITSYPELGKRNILSFSRDSVANTFDIGFHDVFYGENTSVETFSTPNAFSGAVDKTFSDSFFIGDFYEHHGGSGYTGFSGYINDVIIFNESLAASQQKSFANMMIASDVSGTRTEILTNIVSGITGELVFTSGVIGSGVTGFQDVFSGLLQQKCGPDIELFTTSGITGEITGTLYEFKTGLGEVTGFTEITHPGQIYIDQDRKNEFRRENLIFTKNYFESGIDSFEIYAYSGEDSDIGKEAFLNLNEQSFDLETGYSGQDLVFYRNGALRKSGTYNTTTKEIENGSWILSGKNKIKDKSSLNNNNFNDTSHYDYISGDKFFIDYVSGVSDTVYHLNIYPDYREKDLYFMGQKLYSGTSGSYYYLSGGGSDTLTLNDSKLPLSGQISLVPRKAFNQRITGLDGQLFNYPDKFGTEMAWYNGQRQKRGKDYLIISDKSLLSTGEYVQKDDEFFLYNAENEGLNYN